MLEVAKGQVASKVSSLMKQLDMKLEEQAGIISGAQDQVKNSSQARNILLRDRALSRSTTAASVAQINPRITNVPGVGLLPADAVAPNLARELEGIEGVQYLSRSSQAPGVFDLAGAAVSPFSSRSDLYFGAPGSIESLRDTVKQELIEDVSASLDQLGAKVKDAPALTRGIGMMLEGNSQEGTAEIIKSGVDPYTVRALIADINSASYDPTSGFSLVSLRNKLAQEQAADPRSVRARALSAAVSAAGLRTEMLRKLNSGISSQTTDLDEFKAMQRQIRMAIAQEDLTGLRRMGYGDLSAAMQEDADIDREVLGLGPEGSDLELETQALEDQAALELAEAQMRSLGRRRQGLERLLGGGR